MSPRYDERDPLEDQLRQALSTQAQRVRDADDLGTPAIARAGRIRRRRTAAVTALAAVVVLAVAVPLGLRILPGSPEQPSGPSSTVTDTPSVTPAEPVTQTRTVPVDVRKLGQNTSQTVAYLQNRTLMGGEASASTPASEQRGITIGGTDQILWAAFTRTGAAAITYNKQTMQGTLQFFDDNGVVTQTVPHVERAKVSPDGGTALWFTNNRDKDGLNTRGTTVAVKNLDSGVSTSLDEPNGYGGYPLQVSGERVQFALWTDAKGKRGALQNWQWRSTSRPDQNSFVPRAMSGDGWTSAFGEGCDALHQPTGYTNGRTVWQTCQYALDWIGPGGAYVVGPTQSAKAPFGSVAAVTPIENAWPGPIPSVRIVVWTGIGVTQAVPVDSHTVEMVASNSGREAIVRCDTATGQCTRVTPLAQQGTYQLFG